MRPVENKNHPRWRFLAQFGMTLFVSASKSSRLDESSFPISLVDESNESGFFFPSASRAKNIKRSTLAVFVQFGIALIVSAPSKSSRLDDSSFQIPLVDESNESGFFFPSASSAGEGADILLQLNGTKLHNAITIFQ
jgi:hypothetical protein